MLTRLNIPFADSSASDLALHLDAPVIDPVDALAVDRAGGQIELRLLKASHQVVVRTEAGELVETVACLRRISGALPEHREGTIAGLRYRFTSGIYRLDGDQLATTVGELIARYAASRDALVGQFPGDRLATTGLVVTSDPGAIGWHSWHAYPQEGTLVRTSSWAMADVHECVGPGGARV